jgi:hypothetical protein
VLRVRDARDRERQAPIRFAIYSTPTNWVSVYETAPTGSGEKAERLTVIHRGDRPNEYLLAAGTVSGGAATNLVALPGNQLMTPFAGSDFWVADLGLEFLHWPQQRVLREDMRHSVGCLVLESVNPQAGSHGYSRVVSWVDTGSGGIVHADAYDAPGALLKEFDPTGLKTVNGKRQLEGMEMRNPKARSHTWIKFDVIEER